MFSGVLSSVHCSQEPRVVDLHRVNIWPLMALSNIGIVLTGFNCKTDWRYCWDLPVVVDQIFAAIGVVVTPVEVELSELVLTRQWAARHCHWTTVVELHHYYKTYWAYKLPLNIQYAYS